VAGVAGGVDLDGDGTVELVVPRDELLVVWRIVGGAPVEAWRAATGGRIWASPVVADLLPGRPGLEVAVSSRGAIHAFDATGAALPGFPFTWRDELRSLAAGDIDGDGALELVAVTNDPLDAGTRRDIVIAVEADGRTSPASRPTPAAPLAVTTRATSPAATIRTSRSATSTATIASTSSRPRTTRTSRSTTAPVARWTPPRSSTVAPSTAASA
jgi:hypothetical protein